MIKKMSEAERNEFLVGYESVSPDERKEMVKKTVRFPSLTNIFLRESGEADQQELLRFMAGYPPEEESEGS